MKIVVSGAAGYLGSMLVPRLLAAGHTVVALDSFVFGNDTTLAPFCLNPRFSLHRVDCRDVKAMMPHVAKADAIIPLAALVGAPICNLNPTDADLLNRVSLLRLFERLSLDQIVINPSTESVYGKQRDLCTEETPPAPLVTYGTQKLEVEKALAARGQGISLRMATLFGMSPRMRLDLLVNDFTWRAVKDRSILVFEGAAMRTCLHVRDAAAAMAHCLSLVTEKHEVYNLGSVVTSKLDLCAVIKTMVPEFFYTEAAYASDPDARDYVVSDAKLRATGFETTLTLEMGIRELLMGYRGLSNSRHGNMP